MNLGEIRSSIRVNIDDRQSDLFTDSELTLLMDRAVRHIWNQFMLMEFYPIIKTTYVEIPAGSRVAELSPSFGKKIQKVIRVETANDVTKSDATTTGTATGVLVEVVEEKFSVKADRQSVFFRGRTHVGWYRIADTSIGLAIFYSPTVTRISTQPDSFSLSDIPEEYHEAIVLWATVLALGTDEHNVGFWKSLFDEMMATVAASFTTKTEHEQGVVDYYGETQSQFL